MMYSLKQLTFCVLEWKRMKSISRSDAYAKERQKARMIRLIHAIEKGMCLESPKLGFGIKKLNMLLDECDDYKKRYGNHEFCLQMAVDAIEDYLSFHESQAFHNDDIQKVKDKAMVLKENIRLSETKAGGYQQISTGWNDDIKFAELLLRRHSVREFDVVPVDDKDIKVAVGAAQMCPSACNRQAYRVYVLSAKKLLELYDNTLSGIGGFAESADKFILITGKISAYDFGEYNQYIVSASMFASYLCLTLLDKKIGSCIVQRPLRNSKQNKKIMDYCSIPYDEQIVLMMAVGSLKKEFNAPISGRYPTDEIVKFVE